MLCVRATRAASGSRLSARTAHSARLIAQTCLKSRCASLGWRAVWPLRRLKCRLRPKAAPRVAATQTQPGRRERPRQSRGAEGEREGAGAAPPRSRGPACAQLWGAAWRPDALKSLSKAPRSQMGGPLQPTVSGAAVHALGFLLFIGLTPIKVVTDCRTRLSDCAWISRSCASRSDSATSVGCSDRLRAAPPD